MEVCPAGEDAAELGDTVAGRAPGRTSSDELIVFDSTGLALPAAAAAVYRRATDAAAAAVPTGGWS